MHAQLFIYIFFIDCSSPLKASMKSPDRQMEDGGLYGHPAHGLAVNTHVMGSGTNVWHVDYDWERLRFRRCAAEKGGHRPNYTGFHASNLCFKWSCEISVLLAGHIWIICQGIAEICFWRRGDGIVCTRQGPRGARKRTRRHVRALQLQSSFCDMRAKIWLSSWQTLFFLQFLNFMHLHKWFISLYACEK